MPRIRVRQNLQPLGILWCVFGAYRILGSIAAAIAVHSLARAGIFGDAPPFVAHMLGSFVPFALLVSVLIGALNIVTGLYLLARRPWARTLAIVMAVLSLLKLPFGTALGIYTLWVLAPQASSTEWDHLALSPA
jgi:hypothetical protein